ncbi:hypothetical protein FJZ26_02465, partial [Candidatus Parvarchaeota archaeon]|nr:hypothetical protein [Candidatus Parvarchaeota archaeon]
MNICSWCRKRALATSAGRQVLESEGKNSAAAKLGQDGVCCLCLGIKEGLEKILMNAWDGACNEGIGFESFRVSIGQPEKSSMIEQGLLVKAGYAKFKPLKNELNPLAGNLFAKISGKKYLQWGGGADAVLKIDLDGKKAVLHPEPVFIFGRYEKFLDSIGQTSWICNRCAGAGCKACGNTSSGYSDSVHSQIEAGLVANTFKRTFLHASGREDVDVKAMGTGRPFVLEVQRPIRRDIDLRNMADAINK